MSEEDIEKLFRERNRDFGGETLGQRQGFKKAIPRTVARLKNSAIFPLDRQPESRTSRIPSMAHAEPAASLRLVFYLGLPSVKHRNEHSKACSARPARLHGKHLPLPDSGSCPARLRD